MGPILILGDWGLGMNIAVAQALSQIEREGVELIVVGDSMGQHPQLIEPVKIESNMTPFFLDDIDMRDFIYVMPNKPKKIKTYEKVLFNDRINTNARSRHNFVQRRHVPTNRGK